MPVQLHYSIVELPQLHVKIHDRIKSEVKTKFNVLIKFSALIKLPLHVQMIGWQISQYLTFTLQEQPFSVLS